jgi:hypothetical protein
VSAAGQDEPAVMGMTPFFRSANVDKNTKEWLTVFAVLFLALGPAGSIYALTTWDKVQLERDWMGCMVGMLWGFGLLYWPVKWRLAYLRRTAPEREQAREEARRKAAEREADRRLRQAEQEALHREKAEQDRRVREVAAARKEVESFYAQHADLLREQIPEALFRANVQAHFPAGVTPEQAWAVARDVIAQLQPLVSEGRERKKAQEQNRRRMTAKAAAIQVQIDQLRERVSSVSSGPIDDEDFREREITSTNRKIAELEEQKRSIETGDE